MFTENVLLGILLLIGFWEICLLRRCLKSIVDYLSKEERIRFYITGDKHRDFKCVKRFCKKQKTTKHDVLIVLGDAGLNYYGDRRDTKLKAELAQVNITFFCIHGNKEKRPQHIPTYGVRDFCGGKVYYEPQYPNLLFAVDGEVYTFGGKRFVVIGGAHSVDKRKCLEEGKPFWEDEMPDESVKTKVEERLATENGEVYGFLTHTCPLQYLPTEMFISNRTSIQAKASCDEETKSGKNAEAFKIDIDRSTEEWLGFLEENTEYTIWYCGHYHVDKEINKIHMIYREILPLKLICI